MTALARIYLDNIPNIQALAQLVYTNNAAGGAARGAGPPQVAFALESAVDMLAEKMGIDPLEFRLKNALVPGQSVSTGAVMEQWPFLGLCEDIRPHYEQAKKEAAERAKLVHLRVEGEADDLALVDVTQLVGDRVGNLMPFDPTRIRRVVLARAEAASVGTSSIGGLMEPCSSEDEFGVVVDCVEHERGGQPLRVPISPGLYRTVHVEAARRLAPGQPVQISGPAVLAFDGDRERTLADGQLARLWVRRDGPWVIDHGRALALAARRGLFTGRGHWQDAYDQGGGFDCC